MELDITPLHDSAYNCHEDLILTISTWLKRRYELMYLNSWKYYLDNGYDEKKDENEVYKLLKLNHGIGLVPQKPQSVDEVINLIKDEITSGLPVIINMNRFWCPWSRRYQTGNGPHSTLAVGFDEESSMIKCIDSNPLKLGEFLPYDHISKGFYSCYTLEVLQEVPPQKDWQHLIKSIVNTVKNPDSHVSMFESIRQFSHTVLNITKEQVGQMVNDESNIMLNQLRTQGTSRRKFSMALSCLAELNNINDLLILSNNMSSIGLKWSAVLGSLLKSYYMPEPATLLEKIASKILEIADEEEALAEDLLKVADNVALTHSSTTSSVLPKNMSSEITEIIHVDLKDYLNNEAFGSYDVNKCTADLAGNGKFFLIDNLPEENVWTIDNMSFNFPEIEDCLNDNITCLGQQINLPKGNYKSIMLLGCGVWANYSEKMYIRYSDNIEDFIQVEFTEFADFRATQPLFGESIAWIGKYGQRKDEKITVLPRKIRIFAQSYILNFNKEVTSIQLPYCPNMRIFAMSLGR